MINEKQNEALLLEAHAAVEEAAATSVDNLEKGVYDLMYPPNGGLTDEERLALSQLAIPSPAKSALRKIIADAAAYPLFHLFTLLDGVGDPTDYPELWTGFYLESVSDETEEEIPSLHDEFYDSYWKWRDLRKDPGWCLDNLKDE